MTAPRPLGPRRALPGRVARVAAAVLLAAGVLSAPAAGGTPVVLASLRTVVVGPNAPSAEVRAAEILAAKLKVFFGLDLAVVREFRADVPCVVLGREAARSAGLVPDAELERAGRDGFVFAADGSRIVLAGRDTVGTLYAPWALLRRLGFGVYPWRDGGGESVIEVPPASRPAAIGPLAVVERPFFEHRDLLSIVRPECFGTTFRLSRLADPKDGPDFELFGRNRKPGYTPYTFDREDWVDWWHTAPYLVPRDRYYGTHPEYFSMQGGKRIPPSPHGRMQICTTNPEALEIAKKRAAEWAAFQKDRFLFCANVADTRMCGCPDCVRTDPEPHSSADRNLRWVNAVARAIAAVRPDAVVATGAYLDYTQPPVRETPDPNVRVWYAPWFWNSRTWSAFGFEHPLNVTSIRELLAWCAVAPGRIGVYDYPGDLALGGAERYKEYARLGVRQVYGNGAQGDRMLWLGSRILWNPFEDIEPLDEEFVAAFYGPAAGPVGRYLRLEREAVERHGVYTRFPFGQRIPGPASPDAAYYRSVRACLAEAVAAAEGSDPATRRRILETASAALSALLKNTNPAGPRADLRAAPAVFREDLDRYAKTVRYLIADGEARKQPKAAAAARAAFDETMASLGLGPSSAGPTPAAPAVEKSFDQTVADADERLAALRRAGPAAAVRPVEVRFDAPDEAARWRADATREDLIVPVERGEAGLPGLPPVAGVRLRAALSALPVVETGAVKMHVGRFHAGRVFDPPPAAAGCRFVDIRLHASRDVPATVSVNGVRAAFVLHAGEQIVRMDAANLRGAASDPSWGEIRSLGIDLWPQDMFHPYPPAADTAVTVLGLAAGAAFPSPAALPYAGKAVWLAQFRPNLPHEFRIPADRGDLLRGTRKIMDPETGSHERFRTFTEFRATSPVRAILTGGDSGAAGTAAAVQRLLETAFGVRLPIDPPGLRPGPETGNVVLVGRRACVAAGRVAESTLARLGPGGFAVNAWQGRAALAGVDGEGTGAAALRYLEDHRMRLFGPDAVSVADLRNEFLHELVAEDRPWFANRPAGELRGLEAAGSGRAAAPAAEIAEARALAAAIKECARADGHELPPEILRRASASPAARCVASRLARNPFLDAAAMLRRYLEASGPGRR